VVEAVSAAVVLAGGVTARSNQTQGDLLKAVLARWKHERIIYCICIPLRNVKYLFKAKYCCVILEEFAIYGIFQNAPFSLVGR
jgi:hypothetical protein